MNIILPDIKEYEIGMGRRFMSSLYLLGTLVIFIALLVGLFYVDYGKSALPLVLIVPGLLMMGFAVYALAEDVHGVLIIDVDRLVYKNIYSRRTILFSEVRGFRAYYPSQKYANGKTIIIFPKDGNQKEIYMSQYLQNQVVLLNWLSAHFPNADVLEHIQDEKSILQNPEYGATTEERQKKLTLAQNVALGINVLGGILGGVLIFVSNPHTALLLAAIAYVPLSFLAAPWSKGIIYFNNKTNSAHPWLALGIAICSAGILTRSLINYSLLDYLEVALWIYAFLLSIVMTVLMLMATAEFSKRTYMDIGNMVAFWLIYFVYGFGAFIITNCEFDRGARQILTTTITDKRIDKGKYGPDYYLKIKPVAPIPDDEIHVPGEFFSRKNAGDKINLYAMQGRWGSPWYYFRESE